MNSNFDLKRYSTTLSQMVQIATVSVSDEVATANVDKFKAYMRGRFPNVFKTLVERDFDGGIMLEWKGVTAGKPLCLMSHFDVVPQNGTWTIGDPFSGEIKDGIVIGRGTADTKGSLAAIFEAIEKLIVDGFKPNNSIYILSSSREEVGGRDAKLMAQHFIDNKITPSLLVDEGGAIMEKPMAGVVGEFAMMAMSERSSAKYKIDGEEKGKSKFVKALGKAKLAKCDFPPEIVEMFRRLTPTMTNPMKFVFKHFNFFKRLLVNMLPKLNASAGAMVKPTVKFADNFVVLACTNEHSIDVVTENAKKIAKKCGIELVEKSYRKAPKSTDFNDWRVKLVEKAITKALPTVTPTPFIIFGGTDARHFVEVADCVVRFAPLKMNNEIVGAVHGINEYIFEQSIFDAVRIYTEIIKASDQIAK